MSFLLTSSKLATRSILACIRPSNVIFSAIGSTRVMAGKSVQQIEQRKGETHDDKNARLKRPLSPHLSIYRPQYTSILSIIHRITGTAFSVYVTAFAIMALVNPYTFEETVQWVEQQDLHQAIILAAKFVLAFPFTYHACNGVRHLLWDCALFLEKTQVLITGLIMLGVVTAVMAVEMLIL